MRRIVLLSDGTGNAASKVWRTNVWRVFQALDLTSSDQVASYDDGVGTSEFKPLALLGGAFGWGLKRNVLELYKFLCRNYQPDAEIFGFGFSRGAFTIRVLMGLVANQGLVAHQSEAELHRLAKEAYRAYRKERYHSNLHVEAFFRGIRDLILRTKTALKGQRPYRKAENVEVPTIRFIGLWDTVAAYGLPIDEMTRGVSEWIWPLELPDRTLSPKVLRACHALALDDERTTFHPVLWTEKGEQSAPPEPDGLRYCKGERLSQVWFSGVHSNAGGGYPDDALAYIPLVWIMQEAQHCGLQLKTAPQADPDAIVNALSSRDKDGRLYNSRSGMGGYYRYGPRKIYDLCHMRFSRAPNDAVEIQTPKIHESVFWRGLNGARVYAPIGLPAHYAVVRDNGEIVDGPVGAFESPQRARARAAGQEEVWNLVWKRRITYFVTLAATSHLALFPLFHQTDRAAEFDTPYRLVSETVRLLGAFVPRFFVWWLDAFATNPGTFILSVFAVAFLFWYGLRLGAEITDHMRTIWKLPAGQTRPLPTDLIFKLRTAKSYQWFIWVMKRHILPLASALVILYLSVSLFSHLLFNAEDATGMYCKRSETSRPVPLFGEVGATSVFKTSDFCWPSGLVLQRGERYLITITQTTPWKDGDFPADVGGFEIPELPRWTDRAAMIVGTPLRRVFLRPWFRVIGRVGSVGSDEYFLDPDKPADLGHVPTETLSVTIRPRRDGEFFLYVNEAVLGLPWTADLFYRNNKGEATITVRHTSR